MPINQPSNQIKLTNVAIVRYKKGKKRFELACYKNKVLEFRTGVEKDLDEVLQIPSIFINVSKGAHAPKADLQKAFGPATAQKDIILEILTKGELQVSEKEREQKLEELGKEVLNLVAGKCVDPTTGRVYTSSMIEKALEECKAEVEGKAVWRGAREGKSAKACALEAIRVLVERQVIPIARARMRLRVTAEKRAKEKVLGLFEKVEEEGFGEGTEWVVTGFVEPGLYKELVDVVGKETKGRGRVEILEAAVIYEGED